jgi:hypothetical protein
MLPNFIIDEIRKREEVERIKLENERPRVYVEVDVPDQKYAPETSYEKRGKTEDQIWGPPKDGGLTVIETSGIDYLV